MSFVCCELQLQLQALLINTTYFRRCDLCLHSNRPLLTKHCLRHVSPAKRRVVMVRGIHFLAGCQNTQVLSGGMHANNVMVFEWRHRSHRLKDYSARTWGTTGPKPSQYVSLLLSLLFMLQPFSLYHQEANCLYGETTLTVNLVSGSTTQCSTINRQN